MHSFVSCLVHVVYATKDRRPFIMADMRKDLWSYTGGIARNHNKKALKVGGIEDYVHILLSLPATLDIAKAVQLLKGNSSKWVHETFPGRKEFEWQAGYGAFSIGISGVDETVAYIENQETHHKRMSFQEELQAILKKHGIEFEAWMLD
jgi:putative transposase